jgi:hypothetical protein
MLLWNLGGRKRENWNQIDEIGAYCNIFVPVWDALGNLEPD